VAVRHLSGDEGEDEETVAKESRCGCNLSIALVMYEGTEVQDLVGPLQCSIECPCLRLFRMSGDPSGILISQLTSSRNLRVSSNVVDRT
jgi:hypothetical protein